MCTDAVYALSEYSVRNSVTCCRTLVNMFLLLNVHLFSSFSLTLVQTTHTVQVHRRQPRSTDPDRRPIACHRTAGTCSYYSSCLEPQFPCGSTGFIQQYVQRRCEAARTFGSCNNCIRNQQILQWSNNVETCIQTALQDLIDSDFSGVESDPVTCTSFENKAIQKIKDCYRNPDGKSDSGLCKLLENGISQEVHQDLTNLVKAFHVGGDYHVGTVDMGIPELVRQCGHPEVANSLYIGEPRLRVIFCAWAYHLKRTTERSVDPHYYVTIVSQHLNDSESNFQYGGIGLHSLCSVKTPESGQPGEYAYHVVTWFASPNSTMAQNWNATVLTLENVGLINGAFFEFSYDRVDYLANRIRDYRKCGNGRRDPGEMCDYAMLNSSVCSLECEIEQPVEETEIYECTTDRLKPSYCWPQRCGDGQKTSAEECDDGNRNNGDGCSSQCRIEQPQFMCKNQYNRTSICRSVPQVQIATRQITRSNIVHEKHTESTPLRTTVVDLPLDSRGLSSAGQLISRTGLVVLTAVLATLWTMSTLA